MTSAPLDLRNPRSIMAVGLLGLCLFLFARQLASSPELPVRNVSVADAKVLVDSGALVIDVRGPEAFANRHLPGALNVPLQTLRAAIPATIARATTRDVVVYCGDGSTLGPDGTAVLNKAGFTKAVNMESGIQGWAKAGLPIEK